MNKFCVVGESGPVTGCRRTWCATEDEAVEHAKGLIRNHLKKNREQHLGLYVVEVKKIVETTMPSIDVREVAASDTVET